MSADDGTGHGEEVLSPRGQEAIRRLVTLLARQAAREFAERGFVPEPGSEAELGVDGKADRAEASKSAD